MFPEITFYFGWHYISFPLITTVCKNDITPEQPEIKQPEIKQPEIKQPEIKQPETKQPEIKQPEIKQPETKQPETKQPEIKQPEIKQLVKGNPNTLKFTYPEGKLHVLQTTDNQMCFTFNHYKTSKNFHHSVSMQHLISVYPVLGIHIDIIFKQPVICDDDPLLIMLSYDYQIENITTEICIGLNPHAQAPADVKLRKTVNRVRKLKATTQDSIMNIKSRIDRFEAKREVNVQHLIGLIFILLLTLLAVARPGCIISNMFVASFCTFIIWVIDELNLKIPF